MLSKQPLISAIVIDDDPVLTEVMTSILTNLRVSVIGIANNGEDGFQLYQEQRPELVLLDIEMPEWDGLQSLIAIRTFDTEAYVVMLTGIDDEKYVEECVAAGAKDYIRKGLKSSEIVVRLQRHLAGLRSRKDESSRN